MFRHDLVCSRGSAGRHFFLGGMGHWADLTALVMVVSPFGLGYGLARPVISWAAGVRVVLAEFLSVVVVVGVVFLPVA